MLLGTLAASMLQNALAERKRIRKCRGAGDIF